MWNCFRDYFILYLFWLWQIKDDSRCRISGQIGSAVFLWDYSGIDLFYFIWFVLNSLYYFKDKFLLISKFLLRQVSMRILRLFRCMRLSWNLKNLKDITNHPDTLAKIIAMAFPSFFCIFGDKSEDALSQTWKQYLQELKLLFCHCAKVGKSVR